MKYFALLLLFLSQFAAGSILPQPTASNFNLYLSPTGNDANSGLTAGAPILTLSKAQAILKATNPQQNVLINVASGTYFDQRIVWTWVRPNFILKIQGTGQSKPVFDGCNNSGACSGGTFFILNSATGDPTNLIIDNLQVQKYWMGISLNGNYKIFSAYNWNNTISNNIFQDIGNGFNTSLPYSYAALRLYNSRNNLVTRNTFRNVINVGDYKGYIHAIYAASWASSNAITFNDFENVSGDVIRVRDNSSYTRIESNTFAKAGAYAQASDWYCTGDGCDKVECPSWENQFASNTYGLSYSLQSIRTVYASGSNFVTGCAAPSSTSKRFTATMNTFFIQ